MRIFLRVAATVIVLLLLAGAAIHLFADVLTQKALERRASETMGVSVELERANVVLLDGELTLVDLKIANPEGFSGKLFEMSKGKTAVRPSAFLKDEIVIDTLVIDSPSLNIEHSLKGTNLAQIFSRLNQAESEEGGAKKQKTYKIKQLEINGARVTMNSVPTAKPAVILTLPDIHMENVSSADGAGLTLAQVFEKVFVKMTQTAFRTGTTEIPSELLLNVSADLTPYAPELEIGIPEKAKGILEKAGGILRDLFKEEKKPAK